MADLLLFALNPASPSLSAIQEGVRAAGHAATVGVAVAGDATDAELSSRDWDYAVFRWHEPELHDAWSITRYTRGADAEADELVAEASKEVGGRPDVTGRLIVLDHLAHTRVVYAIDFGPPMIEEPDHPAWASVETVARIVAAPAEALIFGRGDGWYDADGELVLDDAESAVPAQRNGIKGNG